MNSALNTKYLTLEQIYVFYNGKSNEYSGPGKMGDAFILTIRMFPDNHSIIDYFPNSNTTPALVEAQTRRHRMVRRRTRARCQEQTFRSKRL